MTALVVTCLLGLVPQGEQSEQTLPTTAELDAAFAALPEDRKDLVLRALERAVMLDPDATIQRIVSMTRGRRAYPEGTPRTFHDPERWTGGVAPARKVIAEGSAEHRRLRAEIPAIVFLPDLRQEVYYNWGVGKAVRRPEPLSPDERFHNLAAGYPPGADHAVARILALLDDDPGQRKLSAYLDHLYADLGAKVYAGVTLYEAWYSTEQLDVPDVDAIPFARQILGTNSYRSPIPANARRERLYGKIRDAALQNRKYRTLREAAAAAFVCDKPLMDPVYAPLVPRFHYLYATLDDDPRKLVQLLAETADREALLEGVDRKIRARGDAWEIREAAGARLQAMADRLRLLAARALQR